MRTADVLGPDATGFRVWLVIRVPGGRPVRLIKDGSKDIMLQQKASEILDMLSRQVAATLPIDNGPAAGAGEESG